MYKRQLSFCRWGGDLSSARTLFTAEVPFAELFEAVRKAALRLCSALFLAGYGEDARKARAISARLERVQL